ncbi:cobalamin-dependent protein [Myxococcaceae bacterium GXIMD 01537]
MKRTRRLLLLAMSGVRVRNERLRALGLTLPGFVERGNVIASLPSLGLLTLASHTPEHWEVEYRELDALDEAALAAIEAGCFDLVALSALSARILEAYAVADRLRASGTRVVLGGLHVSALPQEALGHADAVVQGEGEAVWARLLEDFEEGRLAPLYSSRGERQGFHLSEARVPRYDLLELSRYNRLTLQTTRGCPLDCAFCGASRTLSSYKLKPLAQVRRELEAILALWPRPFIELADDNTFASRGWSRELAALFAGYDVRWFTETDISVADDERLLELLAESGCAQLLIGLESTAPAALRGVDARDWKARRAESYLEKVRRIQSYGIAVNGCFIFGLDGDEEDCFERTRVFVEESGLCDVQITLLTPFPGTALHRALREEGRLLREVYWDACTLFDVTFRPRRLSPEALTQGFEELMVSLYSPEATTRRRARWRDCLRQGRGRRTAEDPS